MRTQFRFLTLNNWDEALDMSQIIFTEKKRRLVSGELIYKVSVLLAFELHVEMCEINFDLKDVIGKYSK